MDSSLIETNTALALTTLATLGTLALITAPLVFEWMADYLETPEMLKRRAEYHDNLAREARARISPFERLGDLILEDRFAKQQQQQRRQWQQRQQQQRGNDRPLDDDDAADAE